MVVRVLDQFPIHRGGGVRAMKEYLYIRGSIRLCRDERCRQRGKWLVRHSKSLGDADRYDHFYRYEAALAWYKNWDLHIRAKLGAFDEES